ncbi:MAG: hypothetical protein WB992_12495 [Bryobacteraceae bacterium]
MRQRAYARRFREGVIACVVITCLAMGGCTDLDQITQFAKASRDVGKAFPTIAGEAQASCNRANSFINAQNPTPPLPCGIYPALNPSIIKVNEALFNYIASLGKLAAADLNKVSGGLDSLSADLNQADPTISTANQAKASAAIDLAKAITNLWANGYRQHELSKIIGENDKAVEEVTDFLSQYAADKYRQSFEDEQRMEASYCLNMSSTAEPLASDLLARKCSADRSQIDLKLKALKDYQGALATMATTHKKLCEERGHWDAKLLVKDLGPETVSLGRAAVSIDKEF